MTKKQRLFLLGGRGVVDGRLLQLLHPMGARKLYEVIASRLIPRESYLSSPFRCRFARKPHGSFFFPVGTLEIYAQCRWVQRWGGLATSESWKKWRPAGICPTELPPAEGPETVKVFCLGSFLHLRKLTSCRIRRRSNFAAWEHFKLRFDVDIHYGDILDVEPQLHGDRYAYVYIYTHVV